MVPSECTLRRRVCVGQLRLHFSHCPSSVAAGHPGKPHRVACPRTQTNLVTSTTTPGYIGPRRLGLHPPLQLVSTTFPARAARGSLPDPLDHPRLPLGTNPPAPSLVGGRHCHPERLQSRSWLSSGGLPIVLLVRHLILSGLPALCGTQRSACLLKRPQLSRGLRRRARPLPWNHHRCSGNSGSAPPAFEAFLDPEGPLWQAGGPLTRR